MRATGKQITGHVAAVRRSPAPVAPPPPPLLLLAGSASPRLSVLRTQRSAGRGVLCCTVGSARVAQAGTDHRAHGRLQLVDLEAELQRKQEEARRSARAPAVSPATAATTQPTAARPGPIRLKATASAMSSPSTTPMTAAGFGATTRRSDGRQGPTVTQNAGVEERARHDELEVAAASLDADEARALERARSALEAKASLYERMMQRAAAGDEERSSAAAGRYLVDFERKALDQLVRHRAVMPFRPAVAALTARWRSCDPQRQPAGLVPYTDAFGRTRMVSPSELAELRTMDAADEREQARRAALAVPNSAAEEPEASPAGPVHFQEVLGREVRDLGVGYYRFSEDDQQRAAELQRLRELHQQVRSTVSAPPCLNLLLLLLPLCFASVSSMPVSVFTDACARLARPNRRSRSRRSANRPSVSAPRRCNGDSRRSVGCATVRHPRLAALAPMMRVRRSRNCSSATWMPLSRTSRRRMHERDRPPSCGAVASTGRGARVRRPR